jgi:hypothetical protein
VFNSAVLVVLYNSEIKSSSTLLSLREHGSLLKSVKLVIWNNGPNLLTNKDVSFLSELDVDIFINETICNESLAVIYNNFLNMVDAQRYIILDDDSKLNAAYINAASKIISQGLGVPEIISFGKIRGPILNGYVCTTSSEISNKDKLLAIGSGMVVGSDFKNELLLKYTNVFDERFYLYGVDTTFFYRVFESCLSSKIEVISGFEHSLSRLESESKSISSFRKLERTYDRGLRLRYYTPIWHTVYLVVKFSFSTVLKKIQKKDTSFYYFSLLKALVMGKHYRS